MVIMGEKVNLRYIKESDFNKIIKWNENELLTYYLGDRLPENYITCNQRYMKCSKLQNRIFAIEDKQGLFIGEIELNHIQWRDRLGEVFMYIGEQDLWDKGYGSDALRVFSNYLVHEKQFKCIYLRVYESNKRAIRCYEKCGFKKRGILRFDKASPHSNLVLMELWP